MKCGRARALDGAQDYGTCVGQRGFLKPQASNLWKDPPSRGPSGVRRSEGLLLFSYGAPG